MEDEFVEHVAGKKPKKLKTVVWSSIYHERLVFEIKTEGDTNIVDITNEPNEGFLIHFDSGVCFDLDSFIEALQKARRELDYPYNPLEECKD
jgi:hypothetical protein